ncbi:feruloyl esterase B [Cadophora sp. MPI-SDFR-AT-0126]|nr:feruloyl esterase B [Leotiomycetes sp. MPI-SDFR-AT-0126]
MATLSKMFFTALISLNVAIASASLQIRTGDLVCASLPAPKVPGAKVLSITAVPRYKVPPNPLYALYDPSVANLTVDVCDIQVTLTHPGVSDKVGVTVWLPLKGWNGRYQGAGGGGWTAGANADISLFRPAVEGWAAGFTDGGNISDANGTVTPNILSGPGQVNLASLTNFAARGLHYVAVVGKAVAASYYGQAPKYSYWNGCSTGGRQGYMLAQKYPNDFNGIMANAPALYWPSFMLALNWAQFLMNSLQTYPSACEFESFQNASIKACDGLDGVKDGIISDASNCNFDPYKLIGQVIRCGQKTIKISPQTAEIVQKIREGPRSPLGQLWDGFDFGINYQGIAHVATLPDGSTGPSPLGPPNDWVKWFIKKDPRFDFTTVRTLEQITDLFATTDPVYGGIIGTDNPDLTAFRDVGGKLLTWHGVADELIMVNNTLRYRRAVESVVGGGPEVNKFYRLFLAPGVAHCSGGYGPVPFRPLDSLVDWVERDKAPETLFANFTNTAKKSVSKQLCLWPKVSLYDGIGDPNRATSYTCAEYYL